MSQSGILKVADNILPPDVPTTFICDVGSAVPVAHTLDVFGAGGATTSGAGNVITITVSPSFTWNVVTAANNPVNLVANNGYIAKGVGVVNFVLPASATVGSIYFIKGYGNLWTLAQNALQSVSLGFLTTTVGAGGSIAATQIKDTIQILCVTANTEFEVLDCIGNPRII